MRISKTFSLIVVSLLFVTAITATWVVAQNESGRAVEEVTNYNGYLPVVFRTDPFENEHDALIALYQSTNGEDWNANYGWLGTESHCSWHGVSCVDGYVVDLYLESNNLSGTIPAELGNLSRLNNRLALNANKLSGPIPPELGNLSNLSALWLTQNQLTGPIPPELGNLSNLTSLELKLNQLTGPIPSELGNLSNLKSLELDRNQLSGSIPPQLGNLSNLQVLYLTFNQLSGPIPAELGNLSNLQFLHLTSNQLSGPIPAELSNLNILLELYLNSNQLSCWETPGVLAWAQSIAHYWDDPPGTTICP